MTDVAKRFRAAVEAQDMSTAVELLSEHVIFRSPIVHAEYVGRDAVAPILHGVATVFEDFRYIAEFASDDGHVLMFAASVGDRLLQGVDILQTDGDVITDLTVMGRTPRRAHCGSGWPHCSAAETALDLESRTPVE